MPVTHNFVSAIVDDPASQAAGEVLPSHWNEEHVASIDLTSEVTGVLPAANGGSGVSGFSDEAVLFIASGIIAEDVSNLSYDPSLDRLFVRNLDVGVSNGTGTASAFNAYTAQGDISGTLTATAGSATISSPSVTLTANMVGHEITIAGSSNTYRINSVNVGAQTAVLHRAYNGSTGGGKAFTIYGGAVNWTGVASTLDLPHGFLTVGKAVAIGNNSALFGIGTYGGGAILAVQDTVQSQVLSFSNAMLMNPTIAPPSNGFSGVNAIGCALQTENTTMSYSALAAVQSVVTLTHTGGTIGTVDCYVCQPSNSGGGTVTTMSWFRGIPPSGSNITTAIGFDMPQISAGSTNWQIRSGGGNWQMGADNSRVYDGTGNDVYRAYTGTIWDFRIVLPTTAVVWNEDGIDTDYRIEGSLASHHYYQDSGTRNTALLATAAPNWQSMVGGLFIADATTVPTGNPSSGGFLYAEAGALKYRGSGGTVTTLGAA